MKDILVIKVQYSIGYKGHLCSWMQLMMIKQNDLELVPHFFNLFPRVNLSSFHVHCLEENLLVISVKTIFRA